MTRTIVALVAVLYAAVLFAEEEIYLYTSHSDNEGVRVSHKMTCQDSVCTVTSHSAEKEIALTKTQRDQILEAFRSEVKRFEFQNAAKPDERLVKIKFRYSTGGKRLEISRRIPASQVAEVSPELIAVFETYFPELDFPGPESSKPATDDGSTDPDT